MASPEHLAILKQGVEQWNKWRDKHPEVSPDLRAANLREADLRGANLSLAKLSGPKLFRVDLRESDLSKANLSGANVSGADLSEADLCEAVLDLANLYKADMRKSDLSGAKLRAATLGGAKLDNANLTGAYLNGAHLGRAKLRGAVLVRAKLRGADLFGADLFAADLTDAEAGWTVFGALDLRKTKGLKSVRHSGPSTIGIDTIYKSKGKIPEAFLKGCGVPDEFIKSLHSLVAKGYHSCFISYSTLDQEFAERLHADLQAKGVRCWFAAHDIRGGRKIHEQIDEAIRLHDKLLLILSEHSMASDWVKEELARARRREAKEGKRVLFPVRLVEFEKLEAWECFDADTRKDTAREIREYFIPDFSHWKDHDSYQKAFTKLVADLKAESR